MIINLQVIEFQYFS